MNSRKSSDKYAQIPISLDKRVKNSQFQNSGPDRRRRPEEARSPAMRGTPVYNTTCLDLASEAALPTGLQETCHLLAEDIVQVCGLTPPVGSQASLIG
jgi:hypothetical protein